MKRPLSGNAPDSLIRICPNSTDEDSNNPMYLQAAAMLEGMDDDDMGEGQLGVVGEKKRRLSVDQVRALEKNFEVENKLEPDRKVKLAEELGLQPRQVAVWFQNRRARWKTKQLEKDYGILKASYDDLKLNFDRLRQDNEDLLKEIEELKSKLNGDTSRDPIRKCVKEDGPVAASDTEEEEEEDDVDEDDQKPNLEDVREAPISDMNLEQHSLIFFADGSSDSSESSAIVNEENGNCSQGHNSPGAVVSSSMGGGIPGFGVSSSVVYSGLVKIEEGRDLFGEEDQSCSGLMFAEDEAPCLNWCYSSDDQWDLN